MVKSAITLMEKAIIAIGAFALPFVVSAQNPSGDLVGTAMVFENIINLLIPAVSALAIVFFFYGLAKYVLNSGDEEKKQEGKNIMIWGVVAMFVLVTIWGIVGFLQRTIGNEKGPRNINIDFPDVITS